MVGGLVSSRGWTRPDVINKVGLHFSFDIDWINLSFKGDSQPYGENSVVIVVSGTVRDEMSDLVRTREKEKTQSLKL